MNTSLPALNAEKKTRGMLTEIIFNFTYMALEIALGIMIAVVLLSLLPYIIILLVATVYAPFYLIGWVWDKLTK